MSKTYAQDASPSWVSPKASQLGTEGGFEEPTSQDLHEATLRDARLHRTAWSQDHLKSGVQQDQCVRGQGSCDDEAFYMLHHFVGLCHHGWLRAGFQQRKAGQQCEQRARRGPFEIWCPAGS
eukprot:symbB.v1.2.037644.t1/scaffold5615.1/size25328/2